MQALSPAGLAPDDSPSKVESASPTRSEVDKSSRFCSLFSLTPDTSLSNTITLYTLEARRSTTSLTQYRADHRQPGRTDHQSEKAGDRVRPAAQPAARRGNCVRRADRPEGGSTSRRSCQRATAASSPERLPSAPRQSHVIDQPAARACPRPGSSSGMGDRREPLGVRCGLRCCSRWSA